MSKKPKSKKQKYCIDCRSGNISFVKNVDRGFLKALEYICNDCGLHQNKIIEVLNRKEYRDWCYFNFGRVL